MSKKHVFSGRHPKQKKVEAIKAVYEKGDRGLDIARKLTKLTKKKVSASAVIGFYGRNRFALEGCPLNERQPKRFKSPETDQMKLRLKQRKPEPSSHAPLPVRTEETLLKPTVVDESISLKIPLMQLEARQCRWGTHETVQDGHLFCGHRTSIMSSYCSHHTKMAQQKTHKEMRAEEARKKEPAMVPLMIEGPVTNAQAA